MTNQAIPAEAVEAAAGAMEDAALKLIGSDLGTTYRNDIARLSLEAAVPYLLEQFRADIMQSLSGGRLWALEETQEES